MEICSIILNSDGTVEDLKASLEAIESSFSRDILQLFFGYRAFLWDGPCVTCLGCPHFRSLLVDSESKGWLVDEEM